MNPTGECVECGSKRAGKNWFCDCLCRRDFERRTEREEKDARSPLEGFDESWEDGGRRSDTSGRL
jgi:hypothetical protein